MRFYYAFIAGIIAINAKDGATKNPPNAFDGSV